MAWHCLSSPWQGCIEEAWTAYCMGSLPIGSVIVDAHSQIIARGRNRICEKMAEGKFLCGHRLAHAEINALIQVEWSTVNPHTCILYTTTEPCPLCVGAIRMTRVGGLRYASRDGAAGSVVLFETNPFIQSGGVKVIGPEDAGLEAVLVAMLVEFVLVRDDENTPFLWEQLAATVPVGAQLGQALFASKQLRDWKDERKAAAFVLDQLVEQVEKVIHPL